MKPINNGGPSRTSTYDQSIMRLGRVRRDSYGRKNHKGFLDSDFRFKEFPTYTESWLNFRPIRFQQVGRLIFNLSGPGDVAGLSASFNPVPIYDITLDSTGPKATFDSKWGDTEYVVLGSFIYRDGMDVPASYDTGYQCIEYGCSTDLLSLAYDLDAVVHYYPNRFDANDAEEWEARSDDSAPLQDGNDEDYALLFGEI